jgi:hypothetical protein
MNDEELEQRLRADIQELVRPPYGAPDTLRRRVGSLDILEPIRYRGGHGVLVVPRVFRKPRLLAAAAVVALLIGSAMAFHPNSPHPGNSANLPATFDMFGRIDANSAWLESGSDLYITRDGGGTWTKGSLPGGSSLSSASHVQTAPPTPADSGLAAPTATTSSGPGFDRLYPDFIDANHGWLLSWTVANGSDCQVGDWSLTVWRTADGGQSWQSSQLPGTYKGYGSVQFTDTQHGWVTITRMDSAYGCSKQSGGGDGTAFSTTGPESEFATPGPTPTPAPLPDDQTTVLASSDGGVTWSRTSTLSAMVFLSFTGSQEAWGYGTTGTGMLDLTVHSVDGARTWTKAVLPLPGGMSAAGIGQQPATDGTRLTLHLEAIQDGPLTNLGSDTPNAPYAAPIYEILTLGSDDGGSTWKLDATRAIPGEFPNILSTGSSILTPSAGTQPIAVADNNWGGGGLSIGQTSSGAADTFQATFDGGVSWLSYSTKGLPGMIGMAQWVSPDDVWVMSSAGSAGNYGGSGYIYATRDGGKTWTALGGAPSWPAASLPTATPLVVGPDYTDPVYSQPQPAYASIVSIGRVDANVGWATISSQDGYELRMTGDGGTTWSDPRSLPTAGEIQFIDANWGWVVDSGQVLGPDQSLTLFSTGDGGNSWQATIVDMGSFPDVSSSPGGFAAANHIHFRDSLHGELNAVVSYPSPSSNAPDVTQWQSICRQASTADGGATWSAPRDGPCLGQTTFTDSLNGYAQGLGGGRDVFVTSDGGQTWVQGELPGASAADTSSASLLLVDRYSDSSLVALVERSGATTVVTSADGGKTWADSGASLGLAELGSGYQFARLGEGNWIALSTNGGPPTTPVGWQTFDGGRTWTQMSGAGLESVASVIFASSTSGWALGYQSVCQPTGDHSQACQIEYHLLATSDGGQTWGQILAP